MNFNPFAAGLSRPRTAPAFWEQPKTSAFMLILACVALWLWNFGLWDLNGPDEGRYVQVAKELIGRDNWLLLTVNGEPYDQKPPLPFWIFALMLKFAGEEVSAWALRLPSVLAGMIAALCVHSIGRTRFGARAGLLAGLFFLSSPLVIKQAPTVRLDMILTAFVAMAHWSWLAIPATSTLGAGRALVFWLAFLGAFFTKGPIAIALILFPPMLESWRQRPSGLWRSFRPGVGLSVSIALVAGWLAAQGALAGESFVRGQVLSESVGRLVNDTHAEPIWYYLKSLLGGVFMPWVLLFPAMLWQAWRRGSFAVSPNSGGLWFWIVVPLLVLHCATGKRHQYLLPLVPPLAILAAAFVDQNLWERAMPHWGSRFLGVLFAVLACAAGVLAFLAEEHIELFWRYELYPTKQGILVLVGFGVFLAVLSRMGWQSRSLGRGFLLVACCMIGAGGLLLGAFQPASTPHKTSRLFSATIESLLLPGETSIAALGNSAKPKYHIYGSYRVNPVEISKRDTTLPELPRVVVGETEEVIPVEDRLIAAGYQRRYELVVDEKPVRLYDKPSPEPTAARERLRFALVGDTGTGDRHSRAIGRRVAELHDQQALDAMFMLGDNIYADDPFPVSFLRCIVDPFEPLLRRRIPFHAVLGNHDYDDSLEAQLNSPILGLEGRHYYALDFGDLATVVFLSSETLDKDAEQREWFHQTITASKARWKIVLLHEPFDASEIDAGPNEKAYELVRETLSGPNGVDLVFAGHNHVYERRKPREGVTHITLGLGGKLSDEVKFTPDPNRIVGYNNTRGFGWIELDQSKLQLHVASEHGNLIDSALFHPRERRMDLSCATQSKEGH